MDAKDLIPSIVDGIVIAVAFIALGTVVAFLDGVIALSVPIWTVLATAIVLPLVGLKMVKLDFKTLIGTGFSIALIGIIATIVPALAFLYQPFTASVTGAIGLIALLAHLAAAIGLANVIKAKVKM